MTRLKWFRSTQPLPEDAPAYRHIGARKVRMVASLVGGPETLLFLQAIEINNNKYEKMEHPLVTQFKLGSMIILKILGMAMLCEGYKSYSKNIPNDARNMNRSSNITHRSLFEICSSAIQTQLKIRTQRQRGFLKSGTTQPKVQPCSSRRSRAEGGC